ncbi:MAG: TrkA family potassium uptake protein [Chloroflexi bacterium]|nr:TrkA family potassium uptake protein [Chloroflexota bacterium]
MKVIIIGCGRLGTELANRLYRQGHEVSVVDNTASAFNNLPADFEGRLIEGDALNRDVLHRAGMEHAEAVAAVTSQDSLNLAVGHIARSVYNVNTVIARNYSPLNRPLFEVFGLQVVSSTSWGAQRIEEMITHPEVRTVFSAGNGEVEIYEIIVPPEWNQRTLKELLSGQSCSVVAVTRAGKAFIPSPETVFRTGDILHVSSTSDGIENLWERICLKWEEG